MSQLVLNIKFSCTSHLIPSYVWMYIMDILKFTVENMRMMMVNFLSFLRKRNKLSCAEEQIESNKEKIFSSSLLTPNSNSIHFIPYVYNFSVQKNCRHAERKIFKESGWGEVEKLNMCFQQHYYHLLPPLLSISGHKTKRTFVFSPFEKLFIFLCFHTFNCNICSFFTAT